MLLQDRAEPRLDGGKRFLPRGLAKLAILADQGSAQAVGVFAKLFQAKRLGADEAAGQDVLRIAPDRFDLTRFRDLDLQATRRLTKRASPEVRRGLHGSHTTARWTGSPRRGRRPFP